MLLVNQRLVLVVDVHEQSVEVVLPEHVEELLEFQSVRTVSVELHEYAFELNAPHFVLWLVEVVGSNAVLVTAQPLVDVGRVEVRPHTGGLEVVDFVRYGEVQVFW